MDKLPKIEFLSFLYAEKNRLIQNNVMPGWSIWALEGVIISILIYSYNLILINSLDYINIIKQITILLPSFLCVFHIFLFGKHIIKSRIVKLLYNEKTILYYIVNLIVSVLGCILYVLLTETVIYGQILWIIMCSLNLYIVLYILLNRDKILFNFTYFDISHNKIINHTIYFLSIIIYYIISRIHLKDFNLKNISKEEFELAFLFWIIVLLFCLTYRVSKQNKVIFNMDQIISRYIMGDINNAEAYEEYVELVQGQDILRLLEKQKSEMLFYNNKCNAAIEDVYKINEAITEINITTDIYFIINKKIDEYWGLVDMVSKTYDKSNRIFDDVYNIDFLKTKEVLKAIKEFNEVNHKTMKVAVDLGEKLNDTTNKLINDIGCISCTHTHNQSQYKVSYISKKKVQLLMKIKLLIQGQINILNRFKR